MIRAISILLILWGCAFAHHIEITSSTPMGMPCGGLTSGLSTVGCMPDAQCGWMVVLKTGDAAAFTGKLTYTDAEGKEQTATVTAAATGEYTALAFRVGVFRPSTGNRFVSVEISALKASATVRQDAEGAVITIGETTWGPPKQAIWTDSGINGPAPETLSDLAALLAKPYKAASDKVWIPGEKFWQSQNANGVIVLKLHFRDGKVIVKQPEVATHPVMVGESLSCNLCTTTVRLAGESLRVTPRVVGLTTIITTGDPAQATTNLKEYHQ